MSALNAVSKAVASYSSLAPNKLEQELLNKIPEGPEREKELAKLKLAKQQELVSFISNVLKQLHEMSMSVINNIR